MAVDTSGLIQASDQKGVPPTGSETTHNLEKPVDGQKASISLDIDTEIRREFKIHAAMHEVKLGRLFEAVWIYYKESHG